MLDAFSKGIRLSALGQTTKGIITGDNKEFLRLWQEISASKIEFGVQSVEESITRQNSWFPCNKGGSARKWYGNNEWVINWENDGENVFRNAEEKGRHAQNYYSHLKFKPCISWSSVSSTKPMFRYKSNDLVEHAGMAYFCNKLEKFANQIIRFYFGSRHRKWQFTNPETKIHDAVMAIEFERIVEERKKELADEKAKEKENKKTEKQRAKDEKKAKKSRKVK